MTAPGCWPPDQGSGQHPAGRPAGPQAPRRPAGHLPGPAPQPAQPQGPGRPEHGAMTRYRRQPETGPIQQAPSALGTDVAARCPAGGHFPSPTRRPQREGDLGGARLPCGPAWRRPKRARGHARAIGVTLPHAMGRGLCLSPSAGWGLRRSCRRVLTVAPLGSALVAPLGVSLVRAARALTGRCGAVPDGRRMKGRNTLAWAEPLRSGSDGSVGPSAPGGIFGFGDSRFCPLCWGGPRRRAPRVAAATTVQPSSSSGLGHRPFKAAARVRIPLGARLAHPALATRGPVEQLGVLATLSRWRSRVQIPSGPLRPVTVANAQVSSPARGQVAQSVRASA